MCAGRMLAGNWYFIVLNKVYNALLGFIASSCSELYHIVVDNTL
jgi:hypothetical protein